jgi:hypothetical protein
VVEFFAGNAVQNNFLLRLATKRGWRGLVINVTENIGQLLIKINFTPCFIISEWNATT